MERAKQIFNIADLYGAEVYVNNNLDSDTEIGSCILRENNI